MDLRSRLRRLLCHLLAPLLVWTQTAALAAPPPAATTAPSAPSADAVDPRAALARLDLLLDAVDEALDRGRYRVDRVARTLPDWRAAFAFVRDRIALQPYPGLRRFADGTLAARAGNACDRAVLLAELLRALGREVRFARARLGEEAAGRLMAALAAVPPVRTGPALDDPVLDLPPDALRATGAPPAVVEAAVRRRDERREVLARLVAEDFLFTRAVLREGFGEIVDPASPAFDPRAALADHCWVRMRDGDRWLDLDPALPDALPGTRLAEPAWTGAALPADLIPCLTVRLHLLRREGDDVRRATVLERTLTLASAFTPLSLSVQPEFRRGEEPLARALAGGGPPEVFVPVLWTPEGRETGAPFDLTGRPVETDFQMRSARRMGETVGGLFGGALGALERVLDAETRDPGDVPAELARVELELIVEVPGQGERRAHRRLVEGPLDATTAARLVTNVGLFVTTAPIPSELLAAYELATARGLRPLLEALGRAPDAGRIRARLGDLLPFDPAAVEFAWLTDVFRRAWLETEGAGLEALPLAPDVYAVHRRLGEDGRIRLVRDVVATGSRPLDPLGRRPPSGADVFAWTLLPNVVEHALSGGLAGFTGPGWLARALREGRPVRLLGADAAAEEPAALPQPLREPVRRALAEGARVLVTDVGDGGPPAFWRYDPARGEVRFVGADGSGQALAEYGELVVVEAGIAVAFCSVSGLLGWIEDGDAYLGCVVTETLFGIALGALTPVILALLGAGWRGMRALGRGLAALARDPVGAAESAWRFATSAGRAAAGRAFGAAADSIRHLGEMAREIAGGARRLAEAAGAGRRTAAATVEEGFLPEWVRAMGTDRPILATPTRAPLRAADYEITPSMRRIGHFDDVVKAVEKTNVAYHDIGRLRTMAKAHHKVLVTRAVNPHAYRWYRRGAVGKDIFMKGKSATRGAIPGLIPEEQFFSKLGDDLLKARTPEEKAKIWKEIQDYNRKIREAVASGRYRLVQFEVDGHPVNVYRKGNVLRQAYEKEGRLYDAVTHQPLSEGYEFVRPLRVVGREVDGEIRYVTADIDLDAVLEGPHAPRQSALDWKPESGDPLGARTPREEAMLRGFRNLSEAGGEAPRVLHGPELHNPKPGRLVPREFPKLAVFPDGRVRVLENPYDQWKLYRDLRASGWKVELPEPIREAYGWPKEWWKTVPEPVRPFAPRGAHPPSSRRRPGRRSRNPCVGRGPCRRPRFAA